MSHKSDSFYAEAARKLGITEQHAQVMDHTNQYAVKYPSPQNWSSTDTDLDISLDQWGKGWPLGDSWAKVYPNAITYSDMADWISAEGDEPVQFGKVPMVDEDGHGLITTPGSSTMTRAEALSSAGYFVGRNIREKLQFDVVQDPTTKIWSYFFTTPIFNAPTTIKEAEEATAELNDAGTSTFQGEYRWVVGAKDEFGVFHIRREIGRASCRERV